MKGKCSCQGCDKRFAGCHSKCDEYRKYRKRIEEKNALKSDHAEYNGEFVRYIESRRFKYGV